MPIFTKPSAASDPNPPANPLAFIPRLLANILTPLELSQGDQTFIEQEIIWMFHAVAHFLQMQQIVQQQLEAEGEAIRQRLNAEEQSLVQRLGAAGAFVNKAAKIERELAQLKPQMWQTIIAQGDPLPLEIPPNVERSPTAHNRVLANLSDFFLEDWAGTIRTNLKLMSTHLTALELLLNQERQLGSEGKRNIALQNEIKNRRINLLVLCQEIAVGLKHLYGVFVSSPGQLAVWLQEN